MITSDRVKTAILEKRKRPGVCYAMTNGGVELPVVDVTHPAFEVKISDAELADAIDRFVRECKQREKLPDFIQHLSRPWGQDTPHAIPSTRFKNPITYFQTR